MNISLMQVVCSTAIVALGFVVGACVQLGHIQQKEPIRTMSFTGSPKSVAQCIQQRLGGKVQDEAFGSRFVIYDAVKGAEREYGITHYSVTVSQVSSNEGVAVLKVVTPKSDTAFRPVPPGVQPAEGLPDITLQKYWAPVERCVKEAKSAS